MGMQIKIQTVVTRLELLPVIAFFHKNPTTLPTEVTETHHARLKIKYHKLVHTFALPTHGDLIERYAILCHSWPSNLDEGMQT
jgi:hypothetical protein